MQFGNGAACRTGLRCASIPTAEAIYGLYLSPQTGSISITLHTTPVQGTCETINVYYLDAYDTNPNISVLANPSTELGSDGWCVHHGEAFATNHGVPVLYIEAVTDAVMVDDVVALASTAPPGQKLTSGAMAPSAELAPRIRAAAAAARKQAMPSQKNRFRPTAPWTARSVPWIRRAPVVLPH